MTDDAAVDDELVRALGYEILRISQRRLMALPGMLLDTSAFKILWLVVEAGPQTQREISDALGLEQSTVNRQVTAAVKRGLVERIAGEGGASSLVRSTPAGEAAYLSDGRARVGFLTHALAELGTERAQALVAELKALNDAVARAKAAGTGDGDTRDSSI